MVEWLFFCITYGFPKLKIRVVNATSSVYRELYGKIADRKKIAQITISFKIEFSFLKCVANLSLVPSFKPF